MKANVLFTQEDQSGRKEEFDYSTMRCVLFVGDVNQSTDEGLDCRLEFNETSLPIRPGDYVEDVEIGFLSPERAHEKVNLGDSFSLWSGKIVATGSVTSI